MSDNLFEQLKTIPEDQRDAYLRSHLTWKSRKERLPQHLFAELTPRCTLSCKMCYVHYMDERKMDLTKQLTAEEWCQIIRESADIGVAGITLTGGEAMIRCDYRTIYLCAYNLGMQIHILTNATLIDSAMVDFLSKYPPEKIHITLYGFSAATYQRNCGNGAAFARVMKAIAMLEEAGLPLEIQTTVTKDMIDDFSAIYHFAKEHGHKFRYDHVLRASECCSLEEIEKLSVPDEVMDRLNEELFGKKIDYGVMNENKVPEGFECIDRGMLCGAGNNVYQINWQGYMQLCAGLSACQYSPLKEGVAICWEKLKEFAQEVPQIVECQTCPYKSKCMHCVALHYADTHEFGKASPRLCWKAQHPELVE